MTTRKPRRLLPRAMDLLLFWHGLFAGAYTIAYLTAEGAESLHIFAGYTALGLLAFRLAVAQVARDNSPWSLPLPKAAMWRAFAKKLGRGDLSVFKNRTPLAPLSGLILLGMMVLVTLTGLTADWWDWEDLHEGIAEGSLTVVLVHVAIVSVGPALKKLGQAGDQRSTAREAAGRA